LLKSHKNSLKCPNTVFSKTSSFILPFCIITPETRHWLACGLFLGGRFEFFR
jgi:hypothetical protein